MLGGYQCLLGLVFWWVQSLRGIALALGQFGIGEELRMHEGDSPSDGYEKIHGGGMMTSWNCQW
jgi:hypothetical protein